MASGAKPGLKIQVFETLDALSYLRPAWEDLLTSFPTATIFATWEWLAPWWRAFAGKQKLLALAFFDQDQLVGLAPLSITPTHVAPGVTLQLLRLMGDGSGDSDNLDLPVRPGYEEALVDSLLAYLKSNTRRWDYAEFNTMPSHSAAGRLLAERFSTGWRCYTRQRPWSIVPLPSTFEAYLELLSSEDRKNLGRYTRRLQNRYQTRFYKVMAEEEIAPCLSSLFELHQKRWQLAGEAGSFESAERRQFYDEVSREFLRRGWLELWGLDQDGKTAAAQFAFRYRDTVYQLQEGYDAEKAADRSGFVLRGYVLQQLIAQGATAYDFLAGEPGYKARWGARLDQYNDLHFALPWTRGGLYLKTRESATAGKEWLRARLDGKAWQKLRWLKAKMTGVELKPQAETKPDSRPPDQS